MEFSQKDIDQYTDKAVEMMMEYGPKLLLAIVTLVIGLWVIRLFSDGLRKNLEKRSFDASLRGFLVSLLGIILKVLLAISVAGMIGVKTTSFVAIVGAAGLAVGLALQGSLSNFAGSVLLLIFRPFRVGDVVEIGGHAGTVKDIQMFATILKTFDNKTVIMPNGSVAGGTIVNLSTEEIRRITLTFGIGYDDDLKKAKEVLNRIIKEDSRVLEEPAPMVAVSELGDSSVNFTFRPWVKKDDFWSVHFDMIEKVKLEFDKEGISIPFPQRDVHIYQEK